MKNITLLLAFLTLSFCQISQAQTIGNDVHPSIGDTFQTATADTVGIDEGPTGSGQVWDFTNLTQADAGSMATYLSLSETPFMEDYPMANLASVVESPVGSIFSYFEKSGGETAYLGTASDFSMSNFNGSPELILKTPMSMGDHVSDSFDGLSEGQSFNTYHSGEKTMEADASGTLKLPGVEFSNVLRVREVVMRSDSMDTGATVSVTNTVNTIYNWFAPGVKGTIISVIYTESETVLTIPGQDPIVTTVPPFKTVSFNPNATPVVSAVGEAHVSFKVEKVYPTPAEHEVYLTLDATGPTTIEGHLVTLMGRRLKSKTLRVLPGKQTHTFDLNNVPSGIYLLNLQEGAAQVTYRIVKR